MSKTRQGIRIINLVYFSQIINLLPHADSADLRRICESLRPRCHPDGTREFTMRVLRRADAPEIFMDIYLLFSEIQFVSLTQISQISQRRVASPALVGFAECFQPDGTREFTMRAS